MSVTLYPLDNLPKEDGPFPEHVNICNGHWAAITALASIFGEDVCDWNGCHDHQRYGPDQLRAIAKRVDQVKDDAKWLRWLADHGGAELH